MKNDWTLSLSLKGPMGEHYELRLPIDGLLARDVGITGLQKPSIYDCSSIDEAVVIMKKREFRKDIMVSQATRLGILLAQRMEDCEGWHGEDRQEKTPRVDRG